MALKFQSLIIIWWSSQKMVPVMAWNLPYFYLRGFPKKGCYFWHGIFPKKCASYGMLLPLIYFHLVVTPKKSVPVMAWKPIPLYLFRGGPIHLFIFGVLPATATTKNTPAHSSLFFPKNHSCSCPSSWSKKNAISGRLSLCRLVCCEEPSQAMSLQLQLHLLPHQGQGAHQGLVLLWLEPSLACGFWTSFFSFFFLEPSSGLSSDSSSSSSSSSISGMGRPWASLTPLPISGMALLE